MRYQASHYALWHTSGSLVARVNALCLATFLLDSIEGDENVVESEPLGDVLDHAEAVLALVVAKTEA